MNGYFNILKPTGMSSAAVVSVLRRLTGIKRIGMPVRWIRKPQGSCLS